MPQFMGKIHMYLMWVDKPFGLIPQSIQFRFAVFLDIHDLWGVIDASAVFKHLYRKFPQRRGARR